MDGLVVVLILIVVTSVWAFSLNQDHVILGKKLNKIIQLLEETQA